MPGLDRTGPNGQGSTTGRGMGYCSGNNPAEAPNPFGMGRRNGKGFHRRFGNNNGLGLQFRHQFRNSLFNSGSSTATETNIENEISNLKNQLAELEKKLNKPKYT